MTPSVSIITPTGRRAPLLRLQYYNVIRQTVQDFEWLILDDSAAPSELFTRLIDPRIHYEHMTERLTIGEKRNRLIAKAKAETIVHFDDDDFYAANYLQAMAARISAGADIAKLSGFFLYSALFRVMGYWDLHRTVGLHHRIGASPPVPIDFGTTTPQQFKDLEYAFGFSMAYRKSVWTQTPFENIDGGEDGVFALAARQAGRKFDLFRDTEGLCLHILRDDNISQCFPQFILPEFLLARVFGIDAMPMAGLSRS